MDNNISKVTTGKERVVVSCAESQSTSCVPNRTRFFGSTDVKIQCDNKVLFAEVDVSKNRNLMLVGGYVDTVTILWMCVEKTMLIQNVNVSTRDRLF